MTISKAFPTTLLLLLGLLGSACGKGGTGNNNNGNPSTCSGTLSGTVNATITDCSFLWSNLGASALVTNDGHITTTDEDSAHTFTSFGLSFETTGDATAITLNDSTATVSSASLILSNPNGAGLLAYHSKKPNDPGAMVGSATITVQSAEPGSLPNTWNLHGTASATMVAPPKVSYSGTVSVAITF